MNQDNDQIITDPDILVNSDFTVLLIGLTTSEILHMMRTMVNSPGSVAYHVYDKNNLNRLMTLIKIADIIVLNAKPNEFITGLLLTNKKTWWYNGKEEYRNVNRNQYADLNWLLASLNAVIVSNLCGRENDE